MADMMTPAARSALMGKIRGRDTKPEIEVRRLVHALGYRFRLHRRELPGCPDLVFPGRRKVVFVHGCFWHRHEGCRHAVMPATRREFWTRKLEANRMRDRRSLANLRRLGWKVLVVWECETEGREKLASKLLRFLGPRTPNGA